jgi:glycosyltransferase involved in cell wall biosynthesis
MRIGILTQYYPPEIGAPQARLSELAGRMAASGHAVYVLTAMPNYPTGKIYAGYGGLLRRETREGVRIFRTFVYPTKSTRMTKRLLNYFSFVVSSLLIGTFVLPRLDYLITESPPLFLGLSGFWLSLLKGSKWIFNVSDLWPESAVRLGVVGPGPSLRLAEFLEAKCYHHAWAISCQSKEILESIQTRSPGKRVILLSNGVDTEKFQPGNRTAQFRLQLGGGEKCIALYAGLHGIAQGLDQILAAASRLDERIEFVFVGDGPEKEELIQKAAQLKVRNVRFLAPVPREVIAGMLASADIAIVPLKIRLPGAVPSKLYEAMASGLPVILLADGEPADITQKSEAGIVIAPQDIDGLVNALRRLAEEPKERQRLGQNGRRAAIEHYNRDRIVETFAQFLEASMNAELPDSLESSRLFKRATSRS